MDFLKLLTDGLSDLHIVTLVWFTLALTILRLAFIKLGPSVRALVEVVEAALIAGVLVFMVIQPFVVKAFYIPSGSMLPTLIENDHILVNRFLYRTSPPQHGDVVVFNAPPQALEQTMENTTPDQHIDYIKRLIGLPGDVITVVGGSITVDGQVYHHDDIRPYFGLSKYDPMSRDEQHMKFLDDGISVYDGVKWTNYTAAEVGKVINGSPTANVNISPGYVMRNGQRLVEPYISEDPDYDLKIASNGDVILTDPYDGVHVNGVETVDDPQQIVALEKAAPAKIPAGEIIVMGDNRNDSNDSSRWGPLTEDRLVGRAVFIFFPFSRIQTIR
jgi:signal peptidase I